MTSERPAPQFELHPELLVIGRLAARGYRPNVLVVCPGERIRSATETMSGLAVRPLCSCILPGELVLPKNDGGTLVLNDVAKLTVDQQRTLQSWLGANRSQVQVISLTQTPLDTLVRSGHFDEALYYRLNVIRVSMTGDC